MNTVHLPADFPNSERIERFVSRAMQLTLNRLDQAARDLLSLPSEHQNTLFGDRKDHRDQQQLERFVELQTRQLLRRSGVAHSHDPRWYAWPVLEVAKALMLGDAMSKDRIRALDAYLGLFPEIEI